MIQFADRIERRSADRLSHKKSKVIRKGIDRDLYRTFQNRLFWLNDSGYVDKCIIDTGIFEPESTRIVNQYVKKGDVVLDVGANIGYYTVMLADLVGDEGKVIAFEPTRHFGEVLKANIEANQLTNVHIHNFGLSCGESTADIDIGISSATIHSSQYYDPIIKHERISLRTLDNVVEEYSLSKIDFIKIDIDGHEPHFFDGAWKTLDKCDPLILFEVSHLHYMKAGVDVSQFYNKLKGKNYRIYYEGDLKEITELDFFLLKCCNFERTVNILICKRDLSEWRKNV
jgi:FkbM family methyltransferase